MTAHPRRRTAVLTTVLAVGALVSCGGGSTTEDPGAGAAAVGPPDAQTVTIDSTDMLDFVPATVNAKVGTVTLTLGNSGQVPHNLVFDDAALPAIGTVTGGKQLSVTYTFTQPGTYDFVCTFHAGMDGQVVVS